MYCHNCGKEIDEKAFVCPLCGVLTNNPEAQANNASKLHFKGLDLKNMSFYKLFCIAYPLITVFLVLQNLINLYIPLPNEIYGDTSILLRLNLYKLYTDTRYIKNEVTDFVSIHGGITATYIIVMIIVTALCLKILYDLFVLSKGIIINKKVADPDFIAPIILCGVLLVASLFMKFMIVDNFKELHTAYYPIDPDDFVLGSEAYITDNSYERFDIKLSWAIWTMLAVNILGLIFRANRPASGFVKEQKDVTTYWTCDVCGTENESTKSMCSHCKKSRS